MSESGAETTEMLIVAATVGVAVLTGVASLVPAVRDGLGFLVSTVTSVPGGFL